jgi:predicted TIM-barrel fold metal-dependent hydrolase
VTVRANQRVLDADAHVVEPGDLFGSAGADPAIMDLPETTPRVPCGDMDKERDFFAAGCSADAYLACMDQQGIDAAVLYPSIGLFAPFAPGVTADEQRDRCLAYGEWIASYVDTDRVRLAGVGILPLTDVDHARAAVAAGAELGLCGMLARPNNLFGRPLGSADYDPLYRDLADAGIVLAVHEGLGTHGTIGRDRSDGFAVRHALSHPMEQMTAMASLMLEGALERTPELRVAFLESGTGWLPYWLARLDDHAAWMADSECAALTLSPSEYFARQCAISTDPEDPLAPFTASVVGADHLLWASDFPHPDAEFPNALDEFRHKAFGLSEPELDAILWDTPLEFYRLESRFMPERSGSSGSPEAPRAGAERPEEPTGSNR